MKRWYIGKNRYERFEAFQAKVQPTFESHGRAYLYVVGPFDTHGGALWAEKHGVGNPHFYHVDDAERMAALEGTP